MTEKGTANLFSEERQPVLLIRADAGVQMGTGHVMRCLALAQEWQRTRGSVIFAAAEITPAMEQRLEQEQIPVVLLHRERGSVEDATETTRLARNYQAEWIVADGYAFGAQWQKKIKEARLRLLVCDDSGETGHCVADFVLNQNLHATAALYANREASTQLLLGPRYALLRQEFLEWRSWSRDIRPVARRVLVTMGGSDPENVSGKVLRALGDLPDLEVTLVAGGSNPHIQSLEAMISSLQGRIQLRVGASNMPELMAWADIAVSASGSTSWELAFMGLPSIAIVLAPNQAAISEAVEKAGIGLSLGNHRQVATKKIENSVSTLLADAPRRANMMKLGRALVDGLGRGRVIQAMNSESVVNETSCVVS